VEETLSKNSGIATQLLLNIIVFLSVHWRHYSK